MKAKKTVFSRICGKGKTQAPAAFAGTAFTQPPPRYSEAMLVKVLEEKE